MARYVNIQNYTRNGNMGISHVVFDQIAEIATNSVKGAEVSSPKKRLFSLEEPINCSIRNGLVTVSIRVNIKKGINVKDVALSIQEKVAVALRSMTELIPFRITANNLLKNHFLCSG